MAKNHGVERISGIVTPFPLPVAKTGTITSSGNTIKGIGTSFKKELKKGDYIWDAAQGEMREIIGISYSLEILNLASPFTVDIAAPIALSVSEQSDWPDISATNSGAANAFIDGNPLVPGLTKNGDKLGRRPTGSIENFLIDATGTSVEVTKTR